MILAAVSGEKKINVIKEVRAITGLGAEGGQGSWSKACTQPGQGRRSTKDDAAKIKEQLEGAGATVEVK